MKALMDMGFVQGVLAPQERPDVAALRQPGLQWHRCSSHRAAPPSRPCPCWSPVARLRACGWPTPPRSAQVPTRRMAACISPPPTSIANITAASNTRPPAACWGRCSPTRSTSRTTRPCRPWRSSVTKALPTTPVSAVSTVKPALNSSSSVAARSIPATRHRRSTRRARPSKPHRPLPGLHGLSDDGVVYAQQNPAVIDPGVFHNDVIAVGNGEVLFYHEDAFLNTEQMLAELQGKLAQGGWQLPVDVRAARRRSALRTRCVPTCSTASC